MGTLRGAASVVAMLSLLAACSGASPSASAPPASSPAASTGGNASPTASGGAPIKIGYSISLTGANNKTGLGVDQAYKLWANQVNGKGGILGRQVQLVGYDDQSDPATAARLYQKLLTQDNVDLVLGPFSSAVTAPVAPIVEAAKMPMLTGGASDPSIWTHGYQYIFGVWTSDDNTALGELQFAQAQGAKTMAIINESSPFPEGVATSAQNHANDAGLNVVLHVTFPPKPTDLTAVLLKVKNANPDFLLVGDYYDESVLIARQLKSVGLKTPWILMTIGPDSPDFAPAVGSDAEGLLGGTEFSVKSSAPGAQDFIKTYTSAYGTAPNQQAAVAFGSSQLLQQAIEAVGSIDRQKIRDYLASTKLTSIVGDYKVDPTGFQTAVGVQILQIQNGQQEVVWPSNAASASPKPRS